MQQTPSNHPGGPSAADKITAAFELLASAFQDARIDSVTVTKEELLVQIVVAQRVSAAVIRQPRGPARRSRRP